MFSFNNSMVVNLEDIESFGKIRVELLAFEGFGGRFGFGFGFLDQTRQLRDLLHLYEAIRKK